MILRLKFKYWLACASTFITVIASAQFKITPYFQGITSVKDGIVEAGPSFSKQYLNHSKTFANDWNIKSYFRLPITDKDNNILRLDRFTSTTRLITEFEYGRDFEASGDPSKKGIANRFVLQLEIGRNGFEYFPTGDKNVKQKDPQTSFAIEAKTIFNRLAENGGPHQRSYQFRLRYTRDFKEADKVGVLQGPNTIGVQYTTDMIIEPPSVKPCLSPAFAKIAYKGTGNFVYIPAIYFDFTGERGGHNPFDDLVRTRLEYWIMYYPIIPGSPNVGIGVSPLINLRLAGSDDFNALEYGLQFRFIYSGNMLKFL